MILIGINHIFGAISSVFGLILNIGVNGLIWVSCYCCGIFILNIFLFLNDNYNIYWFGKVVVK